MIKMDMDAVAELVSMAMTSISSTLTVLLGKKVHIFKPKAEQILETDLEQLFPSPFLAVGVSLQRGDIKSRQFFMFHKETSQMIANMVMGAEQNIYGGKIDDISLSILREVASQCLRSSEESFGEFLGKKVQQELLDISVIETSGDLNAQLPLFKEEQCIGIIARMKVDGIIDTDFYGVVSDRMLECLGIDVGRREDEKINGSEKNLKAIAVKNIRFPEFKVTEEEYSVKEIDQSRDKIRDISLDVSVQIGKAVCTVRDILNLEKGQIIVLDKQAGSPADVVVNGVHIGKGDMIVLEDQFAARITEIIDKRE